MLKWYQYWIKASSPRHLLGWWMMVTLHHIFIQMLSIWCPWNTLKWLTLYMKDIYKGYIKSFLLSLQFFKLKNVSVISKIFNNLFSSSTKYRYLVLHSHFTTALMSLLHSHWQYLLSSISLLLGKAGYRVKILIRSQSLWNLCHVFPHQTLYFYSLV